MNNLFHEKIEQIRCDKEQLEAYNSTENTVVIAGPGSGKTTILTLKILQLLNNEIAVPRGLACITYSNESAKEFTKRLIKLGYQKRANVILDTVHSFCISEVIVPFSYLCADEIPQPINIISPKDKEELFNNIKDKLEINSPRLKVSDMDKARNQSIGNASTVETPSYDIALQAAIEYEKELKACGKCDFEKIIKCATNLIENYEYVRKCLEAKFPWILVDEYQDLGKPLHEMILTLSATTKIKFFAVGDPDQSIYSFQGALPNYLLELSEHSKFSSVHLRTNYRSNQDIIDASKIALNIEERSYKAGTRIGEKADFHFIRCNHNMSDQFQYVVDKIIPKVKREGIPLDEVCILLRAQSEISGLSEVMEAKQIPYYKANSSFLKSKIIVWLKDCATWVIDSKSISFTELIGFWMKLLSSEDTLIKDEKITKERIFLWSLLKESEQHKESLESWLRFIITELNLIKKVSSSSRYSSEIQIINHFINSIKEKDLANYNLKEFSLLDAPNNQVTLSTRHSSKGLEFEVVVMLGMEEGSFPYYKNVDDPEKLKEDRRLFFVCLTRAKRVCYLLMSNNVTLHTRYGEKTHSKEPSSFWKELYDLYR